MADDCGAARVDSADDGLLNLHTGGLQKVDAAEVTVDFSNGLYCQWQGVVMGEYREFVGIVSVDAG